VKILVAGGTGFIGRHAVADLLAYGHDVTSLSRSRAPAGWPCRHLQLDVCGAAARIAACAADGIVHLAGLPDVAYSLEHPHEVSLINAGGTLNVLEGAREGGARVVLASTQRVYLPSDRPLPEDAPLAADNPYAVSKRVAEQWLRMYQDLYGVPTVALRGFSIYGPGQVVRGGSSGVLSILTQRALSGLPLEVDAGTLRDFVHVWDAVAAIRLALTVPGAVGGVFNVGSGVGTSLATLAERVRAATASVSAVHASEAIETSGYVADLTRARADLGFAPSISLEEGLDEYVTWLRETRANPAQGAAHAAPARG
jgi:UDP-glucose 4-epimerase